MINHYDSTRFSWGFSSSTCTFSGIFSSVRSALTFMTASWVSMYPCSSSRLLPPWYSSTWQKYRSVICHFVIHIICTSIYISTACMVKEFSSTNIRSQNFPIIPWNSENVITGILSITVEAHIFIGLKFHCF